MRAVVTARPAAAMAMMRAMSVELDAMTHQVVELKARIVAQRLATYLLNMVDEPTAARADFRLPVNKGLLASWLGCRAENSVARVRGPALVWRRNAWFPRRAARCRAPEVLCWSAADRRRGDFAGGRGPATDGREDSWRCLQTATQPTAPERTGVTPLSAIAPDHSRNVPRVPFGMIPVAVAVGSPNRTSIVVAGIVMAGPVPVILTTPDAATDGRDRPGHDVGTNRWQRPLVRLVGMTGEP